MAPERIILPSMPTSSFTALSQAVDPARRNIEPRALVPDYLPDVSAGASAPVALTLWKIAAIKLAVLLEERPVTRADFKALKLSPTRWTDRYTGWLNATSEGYVKGSRMPDFKAQHPRNYEEIRADRAKWAPKAVPIQLPLVASQSTRVPETALEQQGRG